MTTIETIANVYNGSDTQSSLNFNSAELGAFKFAPITSVHVERSFSHYKNLLHFNRRRFSLENVLTKVHGFLLFSDDKDPNIE